jgi:hypothetical protein
MYTRSIIEIELVRDQRPSKAPVLYLDDSRG